MNDEHKNKMYRFEKRKLDCAINAYFHVCIYIITKTMCQEHTKILFSFDDNILFRSNVTSFFMKSKLNIVIEKNEEIC